MFKVGDKVKIREDLHLGTTDEAVRFTKAIEGQNGLVRTISAVESGPDYVWYHLKEFASYKFAEVVLELVNT